MSKLTPFDLTSSDFLAAPYSYFARLHESNLICHDAKLNAYFVGKYADVHRILTSSVFTTAPVAKRVEPVMQDRVLAQMEGDEHAGKRRIVSQGLHGKAFRERTGMLVRKHAETLLSPHLGAAEIDLVADFAKQFAVLMTLDVMGLPTDNHKQVVAWLGGIADSAFRLDLDEERRAYDIECSRQLAEYLRPIVRERQQGNGRDLISMLSASKVGGQEMPTSEVLAHCFNILLANEAVDKTLVFLFKHLLDYPEQFTAVRQDRALLAGALEETLRLTPPVQLIPRQASEDVEISGVTIPKGALVYTLIGAANRDPSVFPNPDRFDIYRSKAQGAPQHLAFGAGTHVCVGAAFSMVELEMAAGIITDMLPGMKYAEGFEYREVGFYTRGPASLRVSFNKGG